MPVSGLVITLAEDSSAMRHALTAMLQSGRVELGARDGRKLAAVLDTPTEQANKDAWQWLSALPGVRHIDVVFVSLDHPTPEPESQTSCAASEEVPTCQ